MLKYRAVFLQMSEGKGVFMTIQAPPVKYSPKHSVRDVWQGLKYASGRDEGL